MPRCSAASCRNMGSHTYPKDPHLRTMWEKATNKENFKASKHSRLCYDHFTPSDYVDVCLSTGMSPFHRYLKKTAVPSIFSSKIQQPLTSGASVIEASTASRLQISRHLKKGVVPSIFPWTKKCATALDATQQPKASRLKNIRRIIRKGVVPSVFTWSKAEHFKPKEQTGKEHAEVGRRKLTFSHIKTNCDPNLLKRLKKTAVPSIFSTPCRVLSYASSFQQNKNLIPPKKKNDLKNNAVSPQNAPKIEESSSSEINNALRNRSMRLKNRKAYLLNRRCSVPQCNTRPSNEISLHPCPNNGAVRNEWAEALRVSYQYVKNMVACSLHFTKLDFIQSKNSERVLKHSAVPSRYLPNRKKVVVPVKNKLLRKGGPSKTYERQQTMTDNIDETKEAIQEEVTRECRACLKKLDDKKSCCNVFQAWAPPWDGMEATIAEDLAKLANVEISVTDRHSKVLCVPCYQRLLDAATFSSKVRSCDLLLRMRFTAEIDMEKVWPKPIQVDKNINGSVFSNPMDIEIKQEVLSDEEYPVNGTDNPYVETELANLDIKIEPEELVEPPPMNITINGTISLDPLNSENKDVKNGTEVQQETQYIEMEVKQEPTSEGEQEIEQTPDLSLECLLCTKSFHSVTGLKHMEMTEDLGDTACSLNEEEALVKVTTLLDLKKRREALLAQKNIILKRKSTEKLAKVTNKHNKLCRKSMDSDSSDETITEDIHQAVGSITLEPANFDDEKIAQADMIAFSSKSMFQDKLEINDIKEKENDANIDNLKFIEMIENSSINFTDIGNISVMDVPMNELLPDISLTNNILLILNEPSTIVANSNPQVDLNIIADRIANVRDSIVTVGEISNPQINEVATVGKTDELTVGDTSNPQPDELEKTYMYHGDLSINRKITNKEPCKWIKNLSKNLRMKGEAYLGYRRDTNYNMNHMKKKVHHDVLRPARSMKPTCISPFCKKSKLRSCDNIDEGKRKELFEMFWKRMSWEQRKTFVRCHVITNEKKVTKSTESRRSKTLTYFFTIANKRHQVCKKMFLNTLGIKEWFLRYWLEKTNSAMPPAKCSQ